ncbi:MAG: molecular chaperone [Vicinamibacterales bacterium]
MKILVALLLVTAAGEASAFAQPSSVMIWPIHPVVRAGEKATALWLENRGAAPVTLQIRVVGWEQTDFDDEYRERPDGLIASPPMATIEPGRRQLVRLTRLTEPPAARELAYRVLVDELPPVNRAAAVPAANQAAMGVTFRMRYSLPLFVHGPGLESPSASANASVSWRIVSDGPMRWLEVRNDGTTHVRLTNTRMFTADSGFDLAPGLLGYVLGHSTMRWRLPDSAPAGEGVTLETRINGALVLPVSHD